MSHPEPPHAQLPRPTAPRERFPSALRGYDRSAVDDYVRSLEKALVQTRRRAGGLDQQVSSLTERLAEATRVVPTSTWRPTGGRCGAHTTTFGYLLAELQHLHRSHPGATW